MFNIFRNLIKNEDSFTEGLVNLLEFSDTFRKKFTELINSGLELDNDKLFPEEVFYKNTISTQRTINSVRPDILVKHADKILFIEVKIESGTSLQKSQKELYKSCFEELEERGKNNGRYFIFLIPENYHDLNTIKEVTSKADEYAIYITWEDLDHKCFNFLESEHTNNRIDSIEKFLLEEYRYLLKNKLNIINITFEEDDMNALQKPDTISVFIKLTKLIERIKNHNNWKHWLSLKDSSVELYLQDKESTKIDVGFLINHNKSGECLEDFIQIRVWDKPLSENIFREYLSSPDKPEKTDTRDRYIYNFKQNSLKDNVEIGKQIIELLDSIIQDRANKI